MSKMRLDYELPVFKRPDPVVFKRVVGEKGGPLYAEFELNLYSRNQLLLQSTVQVPLQYPSQKQSPGQDVRDAAKTLQASLTEAALFLEQQADKPSEHY